MFFPIDCVNIDLFSIFFSIDFARWEKCGVTPHCPYHDSLTLKLEKRPQFVLAIFIIVDFDIVFLTKMGLHL